MSYPTMNKNYAQTKYNVTKCSSDRRKNKLVKYIVCHYTGTSASAKNNVIYFSGGNRNASADYFIDKDGSIYKFNGNCAKYYSWHCGDGHGAYGITNANSIGIEVVSAGEEFTQKQKDSLRKLVMAIMEDYGVKASNVVRHYDASRKQCPYPYCGNSTKDSKWKKLRAYITGSSSSSSASTGTPQKETSVHSASYDTTPDTIKEVQIYMNKKHNAGLTADGVFGDKTKNAIVKRVQLLIGTAADGVFGFSSKSKWSNGSVKSGSSGELVRLCQIMLICRGYSIGSVGADGKCGDSTVAAIKKFQKANGLAANGSVNKNTAEKLFG